MDWSTLHWPGGAPWWAIVIVADGLGWALVRRHRDLAEKLPMRRVWLLQVLRGLLYAAVVFFLSGPTLIDKRERSPAAQIARSPRQFGEHERPGREQQGKRESIWRRIFCWSRKKPGESQTPEEEEQVDAPTSLLTGLRKLYDVQLARYDARRTPIGVRELENLEARAVGSDPVGGHPQRPAQRPGVARSGRDRSAKKSRRPPGYSDAHGRGGTPPGRIFRPGTRSPFRP